MPYTSPRFAVDFSGIDAEFITLIGDGVTLVYDITQPNGTAHVGKAVEIIADDTVALARDAAAVFGFVERIEPDGKVVVQFDGACLCLRDAGTALAVGSGIVGALSGGNRGYVRAGVIGTEPRRGIVMRSADAANVYVML